MITGRGSCDYFGPESGDYFTVPATRPARTPPSPSMFTESSSPRLGSAHGWQGYRDAIRSADSRDRHESHNDRRAPGGRLKHKWSAVKLASTTKDSLEDQTQTTVDRFCTLSPASQEALLQSHSKQSNTRSQDMEQRKQSLPRASSVASASGFTSDIFYASTDDGAERHSWWGYPFGWLQNSQSDGTRVDDASKSKSAAIADSHAAVPSTMREEKQLVDVFNGLSVAQGTGWALDSCSEPENEDVEKTHPRSSPSTTASYMPTSGSDGRELQTESNVRKTREGNSRTEFPTASQPSGTSDTIATEKSLEQAKHTLGLGDFASVEMWMLQGRLNDALLSEDFSVRKEAANAFAAIVNHQFATDCWDTRLRWDDAFDRRLLDCEVDFTRSDLDDGYSYPPADKIAHSLGTSEYDCLQRWRFLMSQEAARLATEPETDAAEVSRKAKGWTAEQDQLLMDMKADNKAWCVIAEDLDMSEHECRRRFKQIKPKDRRPKVKKHMKKEKAAAARKQRTQQEAVFAKKNVSVENIATDDEWPTVHHGSLGIPADRVWTPEQDQRLLSMVEGDFYRWFEIAEMLNKSVDDCKERHEELRPAQQADRGWGVSEPVSRCCACGMKECQCDGWGVEEDDSFKAAGRSADADPTGGWRSPDSCAHPDAWLAAGDNEGCWPQPTPYTPYTPPKITFWATIESAGKSINIPIDSKHISGPEKSIANSGLQEVWKWIHDKGLSDKVDLRDAFDLAESMYQKGDNE